MVSVASSWNGGLVLASSREGNPSRLEIDRQHVATEKVQAEKPIHGGTHRQGVGDHWETEAVLLQRAEPGENDEGDNLNGTAGHHPNLLGSLIGVETEIEQGRAVNQAPGCPGV